MGSCKAPDFAVFQGLLAHERVVAPSTAERCDSSASGNCSKFSYDGQGESSVACAGRSRPIRTRNVDEPLALWRGWPPHHHASRQAGNEANRIDCAPLSVGPLLHQGRILDPVLGGFRLSRTIRQCVGETAIRNKYSGQIILAREVPAPTEQ